MLLFQPRLWRQGTAVEWQLEFGNAGEDDSGGFLDGPPNNLSKQPEKGILKKSGGIYGSLVGGGGGGDGRAAGSGHVTPMSLPLAMTSAGGGGASGGASGGVAGGASGAAAGGPGGGGKPSQHAAGGGGGGGVEKWSEESQSDNQEVMSVLMSPDGGAGRGDRITQSSLSDVERTLKSLNGYHEDILQVTLPFLEHPYMELILNWSDAYTWPLSGLLLLSHILETMNDLFFF